MNTATLQAILKIADPDNLRTTIADIVSGKPQITEKVIELLLNTQETRSFAKSHYDEERQGRFILQNISYTEETVTAKGMVPDTSEKMFFPTQEEAEQATWETRRNSGIPLHAATQDQRATWVERRIFSTRYCEITKYFAFSQWPENDSSDVEGIF